MPAHTYNRFQAGCYPTIDLFVKEQKSAHLSRPSTLVYLHRDRLKIANLSLEVHDGAAKDNRLHVGP